MVEFSKHLYLVTLYLENGTEDWCVTSLDDLSDGDWGRCHAYWVVAAKSEERALKESKNAS